MRFHLPPHVIASHFTKHTHCYQIPQKLPKRDSAMKYRFSADHYKVDSAGFAVFPNTDPMPSHQQIKGLFFFLTTRCKGVTHFKCLTDVQRRNICHDIQQFSLVISP